MDYVRRAVWGMLYTDDACIVSRSPQGLAKMMEFIVDTADDGTNRSSQQIYKQVQSFTYLGGAVTETPDMSVEIARRTRACWMCIRRYLREL